MKVTNSETPCPIACYGMQANFASVRFSGEFPVGKKLKLLCSGATPGKDFRTYFPAMEFLPVKGKDGLFYTEIEFSNKNQETQGNFSFRVMACPGDTVRKSAVFYFEESPEVVATIELLRGSGFTDIETFGEIELGMVKAGKQNKLTAKLKNTRKTSITVTKAEFNSANMVCDGFTEIQIEPGEIKEIEVKYKNIGRYKTDELNLKLYYNIDIDEEEFVVLGVNSGFSTDIISDISFGVKVMPYTDFDNTEIGGTENDLVYLGVGSGVGFNEERLVRIKLDNEGIKPIVVENMRYSSSNESMSIETPYSSESTIEIPPGEARTISVKAVNKGILGYGIGILSFTSRTIGDNIPSSIKEIHKINFSWGKNG